MAEHALRLIPLVAGVREEIEEAQEELARRGLKPFFDIHELEIEVRFIAEQRATSGGKVGLHLFAVEATQDVKSSNVHSVKIRLVARDAIPVADQKSRD